MKASATYTVVFGKSGSGYDARIPGLPGCVAEGRTLNEARSLIQDAARARTDSSDQPAERLDFVELWQQPR